jgi:hypothetical protein
VRPFLLLPLLAACATTPPQVSPGALHVWTFLSDKYDANHDDRITRAEYTRSENSFAHLDADRDGRVTLADFDDRWDGMPREEDWTYGEGGPEVGDPAPDFRLQTTSGDSIQLSSFRGQRPVALVFGSFT